MKNTLDQKPGKAFYMIYVEEQNNPVHIHKTLQIAEKEAKRLAEITGLKVYILKSVKMLETLKYGQQKLYDSLDTDEDLPF